MQKTYSETIITNNEKTILVRSNIKDHQHDEDNAEQKKKKKNCKQCIQLQNIKLLKMYMKS
jgi:hypothetical protein